MFQARCHSDVIGSLKPQAPRPAAPCEKLQAGEAAGYRVRKKGDDYYAKSSVVAGPYKVFASLAGALQKKLEDFRNRKLFDFDFTDPSAIEIHDGSTAWHLTRSGQDWWS